MATSPARVNVLGVGVSAINMEMALDLVDEWIARREQQYICVTGVHGVMESQRDSALRATPSTVVNAPGTGLKARTWRAISAALPRQSIRASSRSSLGA